MEIERDAISKFDTQTLFAIAENEQLYLQRSWAMTELASRVKDEMIELPRLLNVLKDHITVKGRNGIPLGAMAITSLIDQRNNKILHDLSEAASGWTFKQQHALFQQYVEDETRSDV